MAKFLEARGHPAWQFTRGEHTSYCLYKGDASYYDLPAGGDRSRNAVWTYEDPFEAMAQIKEPSPLDVDQFARPLEAHGAPDAVLSSIPDTDPNMRPLTLEGEASVRRAGVKADGKAKTT